MSDKKINNRKHPRPIINFINMNDILTFSIDANYFDILLFLLGIKRRMGASFKRFHAGRTIFTIATFQLSIGE